MGSYLEKKKEIAGEDLEVEAKRPDWVIDTQIKHTPWAVTSSSFTSTHLTFHSLWDIFSLRT